MPKENVLIVIEHVKFVRVHHLHNAQNVKQTSICLIPHVKMIVMKISFGKISLTGNVKLTVINHSFYSN